MAGVTVPLERIDAGVPVAAPARAILVVDDIVKRFETPDGVLTAVDHVSFSVVPGEFVGIIGPSGCGKSTLFNIIGGLLDGYEGTVKVADERVRGPHRSIGMIFQEESTFPWRNVIDNVAFPLEIAGSPKAERYDRARHFVRLVGLDGFERRYPAELSGGMRQRVSMARTLAAQRRMTPAGLSAFEARRPNRSGRYSYEQRPQELTAPYARMLARNAAARKFFLAQTPSYRRAATWWVLSARTEATRLRRAQTLVQLSAKAQLIPQFVRRRP